MGEPIFRAPSAIHNSKEGRVPQCSTCEFDRGLPRSGSSWRSEFLFGSSCSLEAILGEAADLGYGDVGLDQ